MKHLMALLTLVILALYAAPAQAAPPTPVASRTNTNTLRTLFIDTDPGVDDAVAIAFLMQHPGAHIVGFSTVAGNSTLENATNNLLTLLDVADASYPVSMGATAPLSFARTRTGSFSHGPDGFWFAQAQHDLSSLSHNAPADIAAAAQANPGLTILALGPLTNIAQAVQAHPAAMAGARLVALIGANHGGNSSPVAEFNAFADPHALQVVLASQMQVELVTLDAFEQLTVDSERFPRRLAERGGELGEFLSPVLGAFFQAATQGAGGGVAIPDAAAAIYVVREDLGSSASALVHVMTDSGKTRGQTIIADSFGERITLIGDDEELSTVADNLFTPGYDLNAALGAILAREPDNAQVVLDVEERRMGRVLQSTLTR
jgi:inosine-uridine nucleoside N-ribohydrolase